VFQLKDLGGWTMPPSMQRPLYDVDAFLRDPNVAKMRPEEFDGLPFGAIRLDGGNRVEVYNAAEAELAQRHRASTIGRDFFAEIAPCTDNVHFRGRLEELLRAGKKNARFEYRFAFPWGYRDVRVQFWVPQPDQRWIFVVPRGGVSMTP
jgi:photoactive yellow protein